MYENIELKNTKTAYRFTRPEKFLSCYYGYLINSCIYNFIGRKLCKIAFYGEKSTLMAHAHIS